MTLDHSIDAYFDTTINLNNYYDIEFTLDPLISVPAGFDVLNQPVYSELHFIFETDPGFFYDLRVYDNDFSNLQTH